MPRPDSGFLSGVLAGIQQFKQTRAFYSQMETSELERERGQAQLGFFKQQAADYESPPERRAAGIETYKTKIGLDAEAEQKAYDLRQSRLPAEDEREMVRQRRMLELKAEFASAPPQMKGNQAYKIAGDMIDLYMREEGAAEFVNRSKLIAAIQSEDFDLAEGILRVDQVLTSGDTNRWMYSGQYQYAPEGLRGGAGKHGEGTQFYDLREYLDAIASRGATSQQIQSILADAVQQMAAIESSQTQAAGPGPYQLSRELGMERARAADIPLEDVGAYDWLGRF